MPIAPTLDYYAILRVSNTASVEEVKSSYRKLARDLHPDKNPHNPNATSNFQKLAEAYETIKDPTKRRDYDVQWPKLRNKAQQEAEEKARTANQQAEKAKADAARAVLLQRLECHRITYENELFEAMRKLNRINAELKRLGQLDVEDMKREKERNGWFAWISGTGKESEEDKETRELERLNRVASRSVKQNELKNREKEVVEKKAKLTDVKNKIAVEKKRLEEEVQREEAMKRAMLAKEEQARRQKQTEELLKQREKIRKEAQERERKNQEELRKRQDEQRKREEEERERLIAQFRKQQAAAQELKRKRDEVFTRMMNGEMNYDECVPERQRGSCGHEKFWPKKEGAHTCSNCKQRQNRFAFQCPECFKIACASCRQSLRGEKKKSGSKKRTSNTGPRRD